METVDFKRLELTPGARVLDLGCGEGRHSVGAAFARSIMVVGLDMNRLDLINANEKADEFLGEKHGVSWTQGDALQLPFHDHAFDCVIISEVLEHLHDANTVLAEASRVVRPGGRVAVSVPRFVPEWICWHLSPDYHTVPGGHVRIFTEQALITAVRAHGFKVITRHWAHALHTPYWWLKCALWARRTESRLIKAYHHFLVWDLMKKPRLTRGLERLLNPLMGKSLVLYLERTHG